MNYKPLVSIIINCFNGERFLMDALKSVLQQTYENWEIIFWDNISTDSSEKIFRKVKDKRFKYYKSNQHTTLYKARNFALDKCSGELIAFLDTDDIWEYNKLEIQVKKFINTSVGFSSTNYILLNQRKKKLDKTLFNQEMPSGFITSELIKDYFIQVSSLVVRKSTMSMLKYNFDDRFTYIGDFDLSLRLSQISKFAPANEILTSYRWHGNNTGVNANYNIADEFNLWILEQYDLLASVSNESKKLFFKKVMKYNLVKHAYRGNKMEIIKMIGSLNNIQLIKAILAIMIPNLITKKWLDRDN